RRGLCPSQRLSLDRGADGFSLLLRDRYVFTAGVEELSGATDLLAGLFQLDRLASRLPAPVTGARLGVSRFAEVDLLGHQNLQRSRSVNSSRYSGRAKGISGSPAGPLG